MNIKKSIYYIPNKKNDFFKFFESKSKIYMPYFTYKFLKLHSIQDPGNKSFYEFWTILFFGITKNIFDIFFNFENINQKNEILSFKIFSNSWYQNKYISIHSSIFFPDMMVEYQIFVNNILFTKFSIWWHSFKKNICKK
jgi:hypothetical protein